MRVAFYKSTRPGLAGIFNRLVRWWTRGPYSHVELIIDTRLRARSTYVCYSSSAEDGGVRSKRIDIRPEKWDVIELNPLTYSVDKARLWYFLRMGAKYDYRGLLGGVVRSVKDDRHKYFCSESIAAALGFDDPWRFDPNTLHKALTRGQKNHE